MRWKNREGFANSVWKNQKGFLEEVIAGQVGLRQQKKGSHQEKGKNTGAPRKRVSVVQEAWARRTG